MSEQEQEQTRAVIRDRGNPEPDGSFVYEIWWRGRCVGSIRGAQGPEVSIESASPVDVLSDGCYVASGLRAVSVRLDLAHEDQGSNTLVGTGG